MLRFFTRLCARCSFFLGGPQGLNSRVECYLRVGAVVNRIVNELAFAIFLIEIVLDVHQFLLESFFHSVDFFQRFRVCNCVAARIVMPAMTRRRRLVQIKVHFASIVPRDVTKELFTFLTRVLLLLPVNPFALKFAKIGGARRS